MIANVRFVCRTSKSLVGEVAQNNFLFALSGQEYPLFAEICSCGLRVWEASDVSPRRKFGTVGRNYYICRVNCVHPYFSVALPLDEMGKELACQTLIYRPYPRTNARSFSTFSLKISSPRGRAVVLSKPDRSVLSTIRHHHVRNLHHRPHIARFFGLRLWLRQAATQPVGLSERCAGQQRNIRPCRSAI